MLRSCRMSWNATHALVIGNVWDQLRQEAELAIRRCPESGSCQIRIVLNQYVLNANSLLVAVARRVSSRLSGHPDIGRENRIVDLYQRYNEWPGDLLGSLEWYTAMDLEAVHRNDPSCERFLDALLYFKGFHALQSHRLANRMYRIGDRGRAP